MKSVIEIVLSAVNICSRALNHYQFVSLLEAVRSGYGQILCHTEARGLGRGKVLKRFFDLREEIDTFMKRKNRAIVELSDEKWLHSLVYLSDITDHLRSLSVKLQGKNTLIAKMHNDIQAFQSKLQL